MPKAKEKDSQGKLVYLAEFIGEDNCWEWWDIYDSEKWTLLEVFDAFLSDFLGEAPLLTMDSLKREGNYWIHKEHDFRVWEVYI